jgi:nucleoside-diphosphate-sugar epimerase
MIEDIDISKAAKLLGWEPKIDMHTGLRKSLEWLKHCDR